MRNNPCIKFIFMIISAYYNVGGCAAFLTSLSSPARCTSRSITARSASSILHQINGRQRPALSFVSTLISSPKRSLKSIHHPDFFQLRWPLATKRPFATSSSLQSSLIGADDSTQADKHKSSTNTEAIEEETLFALSSGGGGSTATAVAVIRITGPQSHLALQILLSKTNRLSYENIKLPKARYASLRMLYDPPPPALPSTLNPILEKSDGSHEMNAGEEKIQTIIRDPLDSSLVLVFNSPTSFTGQDMVEIHTHGSRAVVQGVLSALGRLAQSPYNVNIRPADRGEFTQRAFGSGKLGLVEVEALADLIVADTSYQRLQALRQLDGRLSDLYEGWRKDLIKGLAHAEAVIDFGDDEDLDAGDDAYDDDMDAQLGVWGAIRPKMEGLRMKMDRHLADAQRGEILRDGVKVAIVGPPNAGKSSLLNLLADREAAIVSPIAGTTRDVIEVTMDLGGVRCTVSDTAGVREDSDADDIIEVEGIKRARKVAADAHILVCMVDATDEENGICAINDVISDIVRDRNDSKNIMILRNKVDLLNAALLPIDESKEESAGDSFSQADYFRLSCETNDGIDSFIKILTEKVIARVTPDDDEMSNNYVIEDDGAVITRSRHRRHVELASQALERFEMRSGESFMALDMAAEELRLAASELGRITGAVDVEDVLDVLFSDFCIGK